MKVIKQIVQCYRQKKSQCIYFISVRIICYHEQIRTMENTFEKVQVTSMQASQYESINSVRKDLDSYRYKQRHSSHRQCVDYQKVKMREQCLRQIQQLKVNIRQMLQKNQRIYGKVLTASPDFTGILFTPMMFIKSVKQLATYEQAKNYQYKLLSELDKLYEQNFVLEKQLNRARFVQQNQYSQKEDALIAKVNHYQFLRNVWQHNKRNDTATNSEDFIQKLNKKVAMVKLGINRMLKQQGTASNQNTLSLQIQDNFVIKSPKYQRLLKLYEQAMMKLEEQAGYIEKKFREKQRKNQNADSAVQIQNLTRKIKELQIQMRKKDEEITAKEKELEMLSKKENNLKYVFKKDEGTTFEIRIYSDVKENEIKDEVQYFTTPSNLLTSILQQLIKQSNKLSSPPMQKQTKKPTHRRTKSQKTIQSQLTLDQIQKDRINLLKKTNILTQNLSHNNNNLRRNISNMSKQNIGKSPDFGRQKQNLLLAGKLQISPRKQGQSLNIPNFPITLMNNESRTKFVRSSNRQRGYWGQ